MTIGRVVELTNQLDHHKRLAVGQTGPLPPFPKRLLEGDAVALDEFISEIWKWYAEALRHDLQFLTARANQVERQALTSFRYVLDNQRHFNEHADFDRAEEAQEWRTRLTANSSDDPDDLLIEGLLKELVAALECLTAIAHRISIGTDGSDAWRNHTSTTPESEIRAVLSDIGLTSLPQQRVDYAIRQFVRHPLLKRARSPHARARIAAVVVLEMNLRPLSVPYDEILDEFGLIGDPRGHALLVIAHGVETAGYRENELLAVLRRVWPEIAT